jgi:hypothetical protein
MNDHDGSSGFTPSTRGEAAWKEARERVASRNEDARKSGKAEREAYERERDAMMKHAAAARRQVKPAKRRTP